MLAIFEKFFDGIRAARSSSEMVGILRQVAAEFGFADAFLIEYLQPTDGRPFLLDTSDDRNAWWESYHAGSFADMPSDIRERLDTEPLITLGPDRLAGRPPEMQEAMRRFGMAELTLVPILNAGKLSGCVGFSGIVPLTATQSTALQMIAINIFAQMRSLRHLAFSASPATLTAREKEVMALSAQGLTSTQIAGKLGMSPRTVNQHVDNVANKLGTRNRAHTIAEIIRHGLLH